MLVYFMSSKDENRTDFTLAEIRTLFASRYKWAWEGDLEFALQYLIHERSSRGQPGLVKHETEDTYSWQPALDKGRLVWTSTHFSAHTIQGNYETAKDAYFNFDFERVYHDGVRAFEAVYKEGFHQALEREDREHEQRLEHLPNLEIEF